MRDKIQTTKLHEETPGVLFKPMTTKERVAIKNPPVGLAVFDSDTNKLFVNTSTGWCACGSVPRRATTSS